MKRYSTALALILISLTAFSQAGKWSKLGNVNIYNNGYVSTVVSDKLGNVYAGGTLTNSTGYKYIAKWNGSTWSEMPALPFNTETSVEQLVIDSANNLYALFSINVGGYPNSGVAKFNGTTWQKLHTADSLRGYPLSLLVTRNNNVFVLTESFPYQIVNNNVIKLTNGLYSMITPIVGPRNYGNLIEDGSGNILMSFDNNYFSQTAPAILGKWDGLQWTKIYLPVRRQTGNAQSLFGNRKGDYYLNENVLQNTYTDSYYALSFYDGANYNLIDSSVKYDFSVGWCDSARNLYRYGHTSKTNINSIFKYNGVFWEGLDTSNSILGSGSQFININDINTDNSGNVFVAVGSSSSATTFVAKYIPLPVCLPQIHIDLSSDFICSSSTINCTAKVINTGSNTSYQWYKNNVAVGTNSPNYSYTNPTTKDSVWCKLTTNVTCSLTTATSNKVFTVFKSGKSVVEIESLNPVYCSNKKNKFKAYAKFGGTNPTFIWKKNNITVGTNSDTYVDSSLNENDSIWCYLTSSNTCVGKDTSNGIKINLYTTMPSVLLDVPKLTICPNEKLSFFTTIKNKGTFIIYKWYKNNVLVNGNDSFYIDNTLSDGDSIKCEVITNTKCYDTIKVSSNIVKIKVSKVYNNLIAQSTNCLGNASLVIPNLNNAYQVNWYNGNDIINKSYCRHDTLVQVLTTSSSSGGSGSYYLNNPKGIVVDGKGNTYTIDYNNYRIQKFAPNSLIGETVVKDLYTTYKDYIDITIDSSNNLYLLFFDRVLKYPANVDTNTIPTIVAGNDDINNLNQIIKPSGIYVHKNGDIYISSYEKNLVLKFAYPSNSQTKADTIINTITDNAFNTTYGTYDVVVNDSGNTIVTDMFNNRIMKFPSKNISAKDAEIFFGLGSSLGTAPVMMDYPTSIINDKLGNIYTIDNSGASVVKVKNNSEQAHPAIEFINKGTHNWGTPTYYFNGANGIFMTPNGDIYASDAFDNCIKKWKVIKSADSFYTPTLKGTYRALILNQDGCFSETNSILIKPGVTPTIKIETFKTNICANTKITFNASITNGGVKPILQWKKNGNNVGANNLTYTDSTLNNLDSIICIVYADSSCATFNYSISNTIVMSVGSAPNISITSPTCLGNTLQINGANNPKAVSWFLKDSLVYEAPVTPALTGATIAGGVTGNAANQLSLPNGLGLDGDGNLYVSDAYNLRVQKFPPNSNSSTNATTIATINGNQWNNIYSRSFLVQKSGDFYVGSYYDGKVLRYIKNNNNSYTLSKIPDSSLYYTDLWGIAVDKKNDVYVSSHRSLGSVTKFFGKNLQSTYGFGVAGKYFGGILGGTPYYYNLEYPKNIFIDDSGYLYISTSVSLSSYFVVKYPPGSNYSTVGTIVAYRGPTGTPKLNDPAGIFVDKKGYLYVADKGNNRILKYPPNSDKNTSGIVVGGTGVAGSASNQLNSPSAVYVDDTGNIYVADELNNRIQKFSSGIASDTYKPTVAGTYTVKILINEGCVATKSVSVKPLSTPTVNITSNPNGIIAQNTLVTVTANSTNAGSAPIYKWYKNGILLPSITTSIYLTDSLKNNDSVYCILVSNESCLVSNNIKSNSLTFSISQSNNLTLNGRAITPNSKPVKNYVLQLSGASNSITLTNMNDYNYTLSYGNYTLRPSKNNDITKANGVTSIDALLIQRHILNTTKLNSPYKIIAADVDGNKLVNSVDVLRMKRLILGTDTTFSKTVGTVKIDRLWEFVDSNYTFPDTTNPFPFKDSISFTNLTSNKTNQTFIGVKLGDVNYDWNPTLARGVAVNSLQLVYQVISTKEKSNQTDFSGTNLRNDELRMPVTSANFSNINALQTTLHFDNTKYEFVSIESNKLQIDYNASKANTTGNIALLWTDKNAEAKSFDKDELLFTVILKPRSLGIGNLELAVSNDMVEIEAWDNNFTKRNIVLSKKETNYSPISSNYLLVYPNPAHKIIYLTRGTSLEPGTITITDLYGKQLKKQPLSIGVNAIDVSNIAKGMYLVSIITEQGKQTQKVIVE